MTGLGLFSGGGSSGSSGSTTAGNSQIGGVKSSDRPLSSGGFPDDGARRMPSSSDALSRESSRRKTLALSGRSGRTATDLAGTRGYVNTFLGGTG